MSDSVVCVQFDARVHDGHQAGVRHFYLLRVDALQARPRHRHHRLRHAAPDGPPLQAQDGNCWGQRLLQENWLRQDGRGQLVRNSVWKEKYNNTRDVYLYIYSVSAYMG